MHASTNLWVNDNFWRIAAAHKQAATLCKLLVFDSVTNQCYMAAKPTLLH